MLHLQVLVLHPSCNALSSGWAGFLPGRTLLGAPDGRTDLQRVDRKQTHVRLISSQATPGE